jgi:hypothetical protein
MRGGNSGTHPKQLKAHRGEGHRGDGYHGDGYHGDGYRSGAPGGTATFT